MRKIRKTYRSPRLSWSQTLIKEEKGIIRGYGLRRKKEILIARRILRDYRERARKLIAQEDKEKEKVLLDKMIKLGLLKDNAMLDDILALTVNDILDRRLQTIVFRKGLAKSAKQARQHIVHGHVNIDGRRVKHPSYLVTLKEEGKISSGMEK